MLQLELEVVIVGVRTETDLLDHHFLRLRLHFPCFLLLLVLKFRVVDHTANRRVRCWRNLYQVKVLLVCDSLSISGLVYSLLYIVSNQSYLAGSYLIIDFVRLLHLSAWDVALVWRSYSFTSLN